MTESNKDSYGIDAALAASIADMAESATAKYANIAATKGTGESTYTAAKSGAEAGLYVALVTPGQVGTIYNPVFVGADYKDNTSNTWTVVTLTGSYSPASLAKRYKVTLDKVATAQTNNNDSTAEYDNLATVDIGDTVSFKVDTTIPKFGANYTDPVFKVTDELSTGLTLKASTVVVKAGEATLNAGADKDYTITTSNDGYVVTFTKTYLDSVGATGQAITITYDAEVTTAVAKSINHEDNTVTLNFSNNPTDTTGNGVLKDKTNHYSFTIDGLLWGSDEYKNSEVVKVGIDKDGNEITETIELDSGKTIGALQNAEFSLYKGTTTTGNAFKTATTDAQGRMTFEGLDAGTYTIVETAAPAGYVKDQSTHTIQIIPTIVEQEITETINGKPVKYKTNVLTEYSVLIDGKETAKYTVTSGTTGEGENLKTTQITAVNQGDKQGEYKVGNEAIKKTDEPSAASYAGKITNRQGIELPSTGGMGTTILYVGGSILVILAAILLITKRRMNAED